MFLRPPLRQREGDRRVVRAVHRRRRSRVVGAVLLRRRRGVSAAERARDDRHDLFRARVADARLAARQLVGVVVLKRLLADAARWDSSARRRNLRRRRIFIASVVVVSSILQIARRCDGQSSVHCSLSRSRSHRHVPAYAASRKKRPGKPVLMSQSVAWRGNWYLAT